GAAAHVAPYRARAEHGEVEDRVWPLPGVRADRLHGRAPAAAPAPDSEAVQGRRVSRGSSPHDAALADGRDRLRGDGCGRSDELRSGRYDQGQPGAKVRGVTTG